MNLIVGIVGVLAIGTLYVLLPVFADVYRRMRGPRVVRCPETWQATEVELNPAHAAAGAVLGRSTLRIRECARWAAWPAQRSCDQACLRGVSVDAAQMHALLTPPARSAL